MSKGGGLRLAPDLMRPFYKPGGTWGICDRCGEVCRLASMRKEWTSLMVCSACLDPRPAELSPPHVYPEGLPAPNARPEPVDIELSDGDVTEADL